MSFDCGIDVTSEIEHFLSELEKNGILVDKKHNLVILRKNNKEIALLHYLKIWAISTMDDKHIDDLVPHHYLSGKSYDKKILTKYLNYFSSGGRK